MNGVRYAKAYLLVKYHQDYKDYKAPSGPFCCVLFFVMMKIIYGTKIYYSDMMFMEILHKELT